MEANLHLHFKIKIILIWLSFSEINSHNEIPLMPRVPTLKHHPLNIGFRYKCTFSNASTIWLHGEGVKTRHKKSSKNTWKGDRNHEVARIIRFEWKFSIWQGLQWAFFLMKNFLYWFTSKSIPLDTIRTLNFTSRSTYSLSKCFIHLSTLHLCRSQGEVLLKVGRWCGVLSGTILHNERSDIIVVKIQLNGPLLLPSEASLAAT